MRLIHVIEIEHNAIIGISSFAILDPQEDGLVAEEAESCFGETLRQRGVFEDTIETAIEEGYYEKGDYSLSLVWSSINNVQI